MVDLQIKSRTMSIETLINQRKEFYLRAQIKLKGKAVLDLKTALLQSIHKYKKLWN